MPNHVKPIPDGYHTVTPYLMVSGAARLLEFMEQAFGATVLRKSQRPDGSIGHTEVRIGDSRIMLADVSDQWSAMPSSLFLYVEDADEVYRRALAAGAQSIMEPNDTFHGDRMGGVTDPSGNQWWMATQIEVLSPEELARREAERWSNTDAST